MKHWTLQRAYIAYERDVDKRRRGELKTYAYEGANGPIKLDYEGPAPKRLLRLIARVMDDNNRSPGWMPKVEWSTRAKKRGLESWSTGRAWSNPPRMRIHPGSDPVSLKITVLHECAHILVGCSRGHDSKFWDMAVKLYRKHGILKRDMLKHEPRNSVKAAYRRARQSK